MNKDDRNKLTQAGFTILRTHENPELTITYMTGSHAWSTWGKYETKAAMQREITRVNQNEPFIIFEN